MRIICLGSFWSVNHVAGFCHVVAKIIMMNEMILPYGATHYCQLLQKDFHSQNFIVMDGSALKDFKLTDYKKSIRGNSQMSYACIYI